MKRLIYIFTMLTITWLNASAYDFKVDGIAYNINTDQTSVSVTSTTTSPSSQSPSYSSATEINIPSSVSYNGTQYSVTEIGSKAFSYATNLGSVNIPSSVTTIGNNAFSGCEKLISVNIPNSITTIGNNAFYNCISLNNIYLPESITSIGTSAFSGCSELRSINIPNKLTVIGASMFNNTQLTSITIPSSVESIGFSGVSGYSFPRSLVHIYVESTTPISIFSNAFPTDTYKQAQLHVPSGCKEKYSTAKYWQDFVNIVEDNEGSDNWDKESSLVNGCGGDLEYGWTSTGNNPVLGDIYSYANYSRTNGVLIFYSKNKKIKSIKLNHVGYTFNFEADKGIIENDGKGPYFGTTSKLWKADNSEGYDYVVFKGNAQVIDFKLEFGEATIDRKNTNNKCDVNEDGIIDVIDLNTVVRAILGN